MNTGTVKWFNAEKAFHFTTSVCVYYLQKVCKISLFLLYCNWYANVKSSLFLSSFPVSSAQMLYCICDRIMVNLSRSAYAYADAVGLCYLWGGMYREFYGF